MPELTRRPDPHRSDSWHVYYGDIHVGTIARAVALRNAITQWKWSCGFYPGPGDQLGGTADTFAEARVALKAAWQDYLPRCTKADFQAWREQIGASTVPNRCPTTGGRRMDEASEIRVYFSCPWCEAVYSATQKRKPGAASLANYARKRCIGGGALNTVSRTGVDRSIGREFLHIEPA